MSKPFQKIAIVRECESPENPGGLETRVAVTPIGAKQLIEAGAEVFVEYGAGERIGFTDGAYSAAGASLQKAEHIYSEKDLIIKFKGPSLESIPLMSPGSALFCMAHFHSYPDRAELLKKHHINVIAMEHILEFPPRLDNDTVIGRMAIDHLLEPWRNRNAVSRLDLRFLGWSPLMVSAIRRAADSNPASLAILRTGACLNQLNDKLDATLFIGDSDSIPIPDDLSAAIRERNGRVFDLADFRKRHGEAALSWYRQANTPTGFGLRRIQCLHETGQAGARYGFHLLEKESTRKFARNHAETVVLGYGNVGMGAIHECYDQGASVIHILGPTHTSAGMIERWLEKADIVINGAELPYHMRGKVYLVSSRQAQEVLRDGTVVIDLVGGSPTNRSPVEDVVACTFLTDPWFERHGILFSALWGWPMMGMAAESAACYSEQIVDVLLGEERLLDGLDHLTPGVEPAVVCRA